MIKIMKKELLPVIAILVFMGAYVGAAQAKIYYYETLSGLLSAPAAFPFDTQEPAESGDVIITINDSIVFAPGEEIKTIDFTVSASGSIDINDVEIKLSLANDNIISDAVLTNGDRTIEISRLASDNLDLGETDISILAVVDNRTELNQAVFVTAASTCLSPIDADGYVIYCDESDPQNYLLSSADDLLHISKYQDNEVVGPVILSGNYKLMNDVTFDVNFTINKTYDVDGYLTGISSTLNSNGVDWNNDGVVNSSDDMGWRPLAKGSSSHVFTGVFDGNNYSISKLYINRPSEMYVGFLGELDGAEVKNLHVEDLNISGGFLSGGIVGIGYGGSYVSNCSSSGVVIGDSYAGGIMGYSQGSVINAYSSVDILSSGYFVGGLVGDASGSVDNCYTTGRIRADHAAGGLVGSVAGDLSIINSYATGNIYVYDGGAVGGLLGQTAPDASASSISKCHASGNAYGLGVANAGGLVGMFKGDITDSYATGDVRGMNRAGGLVADLTGNITNSYASGYVHPSAYGGAHGSLLRTITGGVITKSYSINSDMSAVGNSVPPVIGEYCAVGLDVGCLAIDISDNWNDSIWNDKGVSNTPTLKNMPN